MTIAMHEQVAPEQHRMITLYLNTPNKQFQLVKAGARKANVQHFK